MNDRTDDDLLRDLALRKVHALAELYDRHAPLLFSLAMRIVQHPVGAETVLLDVFDTAWQRPDAHDPRCGSVGAWLVRLTRERALAERRSSAHVSVSIVLENGTRSSDQEKPRMALALANLPGLERAAIELAYYEGLGIIEIATRLEQTPRDVKTAIHHGLMSLRAVACLAEPCEEINRRNASVETEAASSSASPHRWFSRA